MVARSPAAKEQRKMMVMPLPPLNPNLIRETVNKVDKCMARLQELQYTVKGGGVSLSPRPYLRTSSRIKNGRSPTGKLPTVKVVPEDWRRMSLPAMLLGETMGEIVQATRNIVSVSDPSCKTPLTKQLQNKLQFNAPPRKRENKQRSQESSSAQRAKSRINFKVSSPVVVHKTRGEYVNGVDKENWCSSKYAANRVSPRNRPWATKTVLFPNPLYHSTTSNHHQKLTNNKSPIGNGIAKPHKFLIKSPPPVVKLLKNHNRHSPPKLKRSFSPSRFATKLVSPMAMNGGLLRRSFSPSRLATRFVSPLKSNKKKMPSLHFSPPR